MRTAISFLLSAVVFLWIVYDTVESMREHNVIGYYWEHPARFIPVIFFAIVTGLAALAYRRSPSVVQARVRSILCTVMAVTGFWVASLGARMIFLTVPAVARAYSPWWISAVAVGMTVFWLIIAISLSCRAWVTWPRRPMAPRDISDL